MRYQVVVLASEMGDAMEIESFSWKRSVGGEPFGTFEDFSVYVGLCDSDELTTNYDGNYMSGTRTLVFEGGAGFEIGTPSPNDWFDLTLDTPYWYNGSDNLLIELEWSSGSGSLYTWHWNSGSQRSVIGAYGQSTGDYTESLVPNLRLNGDLALDQSTWAGVKAAF